jgi:DNA-binding transcriptional regulator YiaG
VATPHKTASEPLHALALRRAAQLSGDEDALAARLHVPIYLVRAWLAGKQPIPASVFLRVVDLLIESTLESLRSKREPD